MSATSPHLPLEVASAAFCRQECSHPQLFYSEYTRSNRTRGLKILRCFPHCCPGHIERSYCGTSLSVRVELEKRSPEEVEADPPPPGDVVAVFARFEATSDVSLRPGECVEVHKIVNNTQSARNLEGQWVAGVLDRPSKLVTTIRTPGMPTEDQKPLVFHLNGKPCSRWYYDWESGANKAQRLMKHVLKAYVVERCAVDENGRFVAYTSRDATTLLYRILHVVTSTEFTIISYRRAASEQYQASLKQAAQALPGDTTGTPPPTRQHFTAHSEASVAPLRPPNVKVEHSYGHAFEAKRQSFPARASYSPCDNQLEKNFWWGHPNSSTSRVSTNFALVHALLQWAPLSMCGPLVNDFTQVINQSVSEPLADFSGELPRINIFSRFVLDQVGSIRGNVVASAFGNGNRRACGDMIAPPSTLQKLLLVLTQATGWLFSAETRRWLQSFFRQYARAILDKNTLRECFALLVQELQERLDTQVFAHTELRSLENVAEEVIAAVYSYPYFHARRPQVREILSRATFPGWRAFVAQMRETYISVSRSTAMARGLASPQPGLGFSLAFPPKNSIENAWNAEWFLNANEASWRFSDQAMKPSEDDNYDADSFSHADSTLSLFTVFQIISQLVRLEMALDIEARMLQIRSTQGISGALDAMRLVLDGKARVFSQYPNGMTSSIGAGVHGDYFGEMRVEPPGRCIVCLQIFKWSESEETPSYHIRTRLECWRGRRLCISGDVLVTTDPCCFTAEDIASLGEMSLQRKREAVKHTHSRQQRADFRNAATTWKELGKYQFSYLKSSNASGQDFM